MTARDFLRLHGTSGGCKKTSRDFDRLRWFRWTSYDFRREVSAVSPLNLVYMDCVILEVCRLHPPLPLDFKVCAREIHLPGTTNIILPKSIIVSYTPYHFHRLSSVWGLDAMDFKPERWLDSDGKIKIESQFKFLSFNAGPRLRLGKVMALLEVKILAATLLNEYHFQLDDENNFNANIKFTSTCLFSNGLKMTVIRR